MVHSEKGELIMASVDRPTLLTTLGPEWLPSGGLPEESLMGPLAELGAERGEGERKREDKKGNRDSEPERQKKGKEKATNG